MLSLIQNVMGKRALKKPAILSNTLALKYGGGFYDVGLITTFTFFWVFIALSNCMKSCPNHLHLKAGTNEPLKESNLANANAGYGCQTINNEEGGAHFATTVPLNRQRKLSSTCSWLNNKQLFDLFFCRGLSGSHVLRKRILSGWKVCLWHWVDGRRLPIQEPLPGPMFSRLLLPWHLHCRVGKVWLWRSLDWAWLQHQ